MSTLFIPQNTWFKVLHDTPYNHKLEFVAMKCKARMCEVLAVWLCELDAASKHDPRGISDADPELVAFKQEIDLKLVQKIMATFRSPDAHGNPLLIDKKGRIISWHKVQPMTPTERSQKHRATQKRKMQQQNKSRNAGALHQDAEAKKPSKAKASKPKSQGRNEPAEATQDEARNAGALQPLQTKKEKNQKKEISKQRGVEQNGGEQSKAETETEKTHTGEERESTRGKAEENQGESTPGEEETSGTDLPHPSHPEGGEEKGGSAEAEQAGPPADQELAPQLVATWNRIVSSQPVSKLTDKRLKLIRQRLEDSFGHDITRWEHFCRTVAASDFLMGRTGDGFTADFSWCLASEDRVAQILEGKYSAGRHPKVPPAQVIPPGQLPEGAAEAWARVENSLRQLAQTKPELRHLSLYDVRDDGAVVLAAPTEFEAEWCQDKHREDIMSLLEAEPYFGNTMTALVIRNPQP